LSAEWESERNEVILKEKRALPYCCRAVEFFIQALEINLKTQTATVNTMLCPALSIRKAQLFITYISSA